MTASCVGSIAFGGNTQSSGSVSDEMTAAVCKQFILKDVSFASSPTASFLSTSPADMLITAMVTKATSSDLMSTSPVITEFVGCETDDGVFTSVHCSMTPMEDDDWQDDVLYGVNDHTISSPAGTSLNFNGHQIDEDIPDKAWCRMSARERLDVCQALSHHLVSSLSLRERTEALGIVRGHMPRHWMHSDDTIIEHDELSNESYERLRIFLKRHVSSSHSLSKGSWQKMDTIRQKNSLVRKKQHSVIKKQKPAPEIGGGFQHETDDTSFIKTKLRKIQRQKMKEKRSGLFANEQVVTVSAKGLSVLSSGSDTCDTEDIDIME